MKGVIIIDGKNFCYRAHYAHAGLSSEGRPTSVLYGGLSMLLNLARRLPQNHIVFCWDGRDRTWRHELYSEYKSNRLPSADTKLVVGQIEAFRAILSQLGIQQFEVPAVECDDVIGVLVYRLFELGICNPIIISSTDRDFYQLVNQVVRIARENKDNKIRLIDPKGVFQEFGVYPREWLDYRSLCGDKTDCIPAAIQRLGPKTAAKFIRLGFSSAYERWEDMPYEYQQRFAQFKPIWQRITLTRRLSSIIMQPLACSFVSEQARSGLQLLREQIAADTIRRDPLGFSKAAYSALIDFLAEYEMSELIGRRQELMTIGR